jgi:hypothetical protein
MASVWIQEAKDKAPRKLQGGLTETGAVHMFKDMLRRWLGPQVAVGAHDVLLYRKAPDVMGKKPAANLFIEFHAPPTKPESWELIRETLLRARKPGKPATPSAG